MNLHDALKTWVPLYYRPDSNTWACMIDNGWISLQLGGKLRITACFYCKETGEIKAHTTQREIRTYTTQNLETDR